MPTSNTTITLRAAIAAPESAADATVAEWSISDSVGNVSRQVDLFNATLDPALQIGADVTVAAGYDQSRITLFSGELDDVVVKLTPDSRSANARGRDAGIMEAQRRTLARTWTVIPPRGLVRAHQVIRDAALKVGLTIGYLAFSDYVLNNEYTVNGATILDIVSQLIAPFNLFERIRYFPQIRGSELSVLKVDWTNPRPNGTVITRGQMETLEIKQTRYLAEPDLTQMDDLIVRGATFVVGKVALGRTVHIEYMRSTEPQEVRQATGNQVTKDQTEANAAENPPQLIEIQTEVVTTEVRFGDKVLTRDEKTYINNELNSQTIDVNYYYEPAPPSDTEDPNKVQTDLSGIEASSLEPTDTCLLRATHSSRYGLKEVTQRTIALSNVTVTIFTEVFRSRKEFFYNARHEILSEQEWTQELQEVQTPDDLHPGQTIQSLEWGYSLYHARTHSQFTSGTVKTQLLSFEFVNSKFQLSQAQSQHVGGSLPKLNETASRDNVTAVQFQSPTYIIGGNGVPVVFTQNRTVWSYDNPLLGQDMCDTVRQFALDEKSFQLAGYRWEEASLEGILNPNLRSGQPVSVEMGAGVFRDFWLDSVGHKFAENGAKTQATVKRLTLEALS